MPNDDVTLRHPGDVALATYADELAAEIAKTAARYDESGEFPAEHFELLRQRGALALTIPKEYGGRGLSLYELLLFQERLAQGSGSTALSLGWHLMAFGYLSFDLKWPRPVFERLCRDVVQKGHLVNILITERDAGNLLRGGPPTTTARRTAQGWVISGRKAFCSAAPELQQMIIYAWIGGEQRQAEFLVPRTDGMHVIENWNTLGMRSTGSHDIEFDEVLVPHDALLNYIEKDKPSSFTTGSRAFGLQIAAVYLGIATAARNFTLQFAAEHRPPSLGHPILDAPQVQLKIGEIELLLGAAKTLLYGLAERWERYPDIQHRLHQEVWTAKHTVTNHAVRIVEIAMSIVGGHALSRDLPLERYFRDVQCGLYNPPQNDMVISSLAQTAVKRQRNQSVKEKTPAPASALPGIPAAVDAVAA
ncbi:acyl-CoA dehydrogenase family protein [Azohydromonas caseinilytica]|uniref:Acyl-CoA/acyl-ACP dehydrogenase n=1 Tax=Azohydromonas caseinilytica TaxID=2728836 RepID=A0A848FKV0_9BURK|nr:acyl-CoA dehydrogenase family protein [Azohydromonas caseinilytica]NML18863.1 acyl-CoA/acyl-ACP dehydrogenase [Azohydromonas caseinilytica]